MLKVSKFGSFGSEKDTKGEVMSINAKKRKQVFEKYAESEEYGNCAYCGCRLKLNNKSTLEYPVMQVDHITPCFRNDPKLRNINDNLDNLNPACPRCNKWKETFTINEFRMLIFLKVGRMINTSAHFRLMIDYGLVELTEKKIEFYFERFNYFKDNCSKKELK